MYQNNTKSKKDLKIMAFGFFAIAVVTLAFFLKPCFFDKEINQESKMALPKM